MRHHLPQARTGTFESDDHRLTHCSACLLLYEGCSDDGECDRTFAAGAGQLEVTSVGGDGDQFRAVATDVELMQASVDPFNNEVRLLEHGAGWCIERVEWDVVIGQGVGD